MWSCVAGFDGSGEYIGGGGLSGLCGTFGDQQSIQAACEANPECKGYTWYDGTMPGFLRPPGWWCLRTSAQPSPSPYMRLCARPPPGRLLSLSAVPSRACARARLNPCHLHARPRERGGERETRAHNSLLRHGAAVDGFADVQGQGRAAVVAGRNRDSGRTPRGRPPQAH